jgi:hypothetical protein
MNQEPKKGKSKRTILGFSRQFKMDIVLGWSEWIVIVQAKDSNTSPKLRVMHSNNK